MDQGVYRLVIDRIECQIEGVVPPAVLKGVTLAIATDGSTVSCKVRIDDLTPGVPVAVEFVTVFASSATLTIVDGRRREAGTTVIQHPHDVAGLHSSFVSVARATSQATSPCLHHP